MVQNKYAIKKYKAIKKKSSFLLEFRLFEGDSDIERLITNVFTTMDILHKTANDKKELITNKKNVEKQPVYNNGDEYNNNDNNSNSYINPNLLGGKRRNKPHKTEKSLSLNINR
jgi:hypothetical protein